MKIGDRIYVRGYVDEIRKDTVIVRNDGGYFGTIPSEVTPSAEPEKRTEKRTETHTCDCISRQAAIRVAEAHWYKPEITIGIKNLPSAESEIIRCKDCKYWRSDHTCQEHSLVSPMLANDFCSRAERRGEQDETD